MEHEMKTTKKTASKKIARTASTKADKTKKVVKKAAGKAVKASKTAKAAPAKKVVAKKGVAKKAGKKVKKVKLVSISRADILARLSDAAEITTKQAKLVFGELEAIITEAVSKKGTGLFKFPGLFKVQAVHVPAKPKRRGINPFTKEEQDFPAKPATTKVKLRPMKKLKAAALA
jgi:nucleoid DNA-binding protein